MNTKRFLYLQSFTSSSVRAFTFKFYKGLSLHGFLKQFYPKTFSSDIQEREEQKKKSPKNNKKQQQKQQKKTKNVERRRHHQHNKSILQQINYS